jgi:hypothetical protein
MTQPPKISPLALQSPGMGITFKTRTWSVGSSTAEEGKVSDMGTISV